MNAQTMLSETKRASWFMISAASAVLASAGTASAGVPVWAVDSMGSTQTDLVNSDRIVVFDSDQPHKAVAIGETGVSGTHMAGLSFNPEGDLFAYGQTGQIGLYRLSKLDGEAKFIGSGGLQSGHVVSDLAWNDTLEGMYAVGRSTTDGTVALYSINLVTGRASLVSTISGMSKAKGFDVSLAADSFGTFFVHDAFTDMIYQIDSGYSANPLMSIPFDSDLSQGLGIDWSRDNTMYFGAFNDESYRTELWVVDLDKLSMSFGNFIGKLGPDNVLPEFQTGDVAVLPITAQFGDSELGGLTSEYATYLEWEQLAATPTEDEHGKDVMNQAKKLSSRLKKMQRKLINALDFEDRLLQAQRELADALARRDAGEDVSDNEISKLEKRVAKLEKKVQKKTDAYTRKRDQAAEFAAVLEEMIHDDGDGEGGEGGGGGGGGGDGGGGGGGEGGDEIKPPPPPPPYDDPGWTVFEPSPDSRLIYVSSSKGNDKNSGRDPSNPVRTLAKAKSMMRDGYPDWILLKRGDVWKEAFGTLSHQGSGPFSGRSAQEPMVFTSYGDGPRPLLKIGSADGWAPWSSESKVTSHVVLHDIHFYAHTRDPDSSEYKGKNGGTGVNILSTGRNVFVENCRFDFCGIVIAPYQRGNAKPRFKNFRFRRNVVYGHYSSGGHAQGMFATDTDGIILEENVFDHNGWNDKVGAERTKFNHNVYVTTYCTDLFAYGNVFGRGSSSGLQARCGGMIRANLFVGNAAQLNFGWYAGVADPYPGGVTGRVHRNVIMDSRPVKEGGSNGDDAEWAIALGNIRESIIDDNLTIRSGDVTISGYTEKNRVGVKNTRIHNNRFIAEDDYAIDILFTAFTNVTIDHNTIDGGKADMRDRDGGKRKIDFYINDYTADEKELIETIDYYHEMIGRPGSLEAYMAFARHQQRGHWDWKYCGSWASNWLETRVDK